MHRAKWGMPAPLARPQWPEAPSWNGRSLGGPMRGPPAGPCSTLVYASAPERACSVKNAMSLVTPLPGRPKISQSLS